LLDLHNKLHESFQILGLVEVKERLQPRVPDADVAQHDLDVVKEFFENVFRKTQQVLCSWLAKKFRENLEVFIEKSDPWLCGKI